MKFGFRRTTHDKSGRYRQELGDPTIDRHEEWIIHMLHPNRVITFDELLEEVWSYNDQEREPREESAMVALGLVRLLESDRASLEVGK